MSDCIQFDLHLLHTIQTAIFSTRESNLMLFYANLISF